MCHVLIIEDEAFIAMDLQSLLEKEGATSFAFADSEDEAIASALAQRPDFITSDVKLIEGTGPRAVASICARCGPIPVLFVTGTPEACEPCEPCEPCDATSAILRKPVNPRAVIEAFHRMKP